MSIKDSFIAQMKQEAILTRNMLEKVPPDKKDWKPHEKLISLGRLASHVAANTHWASEIFHIDDFDAWMGIQPHHSSPQPVISIPASCRCFYSGYVKPKRR